MRDTALAALEGLGVLDGGGIPGFALDGQALEDRPVVRPGDGELLAECLSILSEHRVTALVRGSGSQLEVGNPARSIDVVLDTRSLSGVGDFERDDGVVQVQAGTALPELREQVEAEGWVLPLDPPGADATVGGTIASGALGPRGLGFGRSRDCVLGLDVAFTSGERTSCGGRVVKNVTGYDMAKLYAGSFGTLGVIESAWLRLKPEPELTRTLCFESSDLERSFALVLDGSRRTTARVGALLSPVAARCAGVEGRSAHGWRTVLELAGDEAAARSDRAWLMDRAASGACELFGAPDASASSTSPTSPTSSDPIERVRALQGGTLTAGGVRARIAASPSALVPAASVLVAAGAGVLAYPALGLLYAYSGNGDGGSSRLIEASTRAAATAGGALLFECVPSELKSERDVFGNFGTELALMRTLKQRFDPEGVLNPGRFAGGI